LVEADSRQIAGSRVAVGVRSAAHKVTLSPDPSRVTQEGDELLLVCAMSDVPVLQELLGASSR
jgi:hypothetical protein